MKLFLTRNASKKRAVQWLLDCQQVRDKPAKYAHYQPVILSHETRYTRLHD
jgi:hypothetical protein